MIAPIQPTHCLSEERLTFFKSLLLLERIESRSYPLPVDLDGEADHLLAPLVQSMLGSQWLRKFHSAKAGGLVYRATRMGLIQLERFYQRYIEFLNIFGVFAAVDLSSGEFAFADYYSMEEEEWEDYISSDCWSDVRVAVAEFKEVDPFEVIFMAFLHEGRYDFLDGNWQKELTSGQTWDEIEEVVAESVTLDQLSCLYQGHSLTSNAEDMMCDIIKRGVEINVKLWQNERKMVETGSLQPPEYEIDEEFFTPYLHDPAYRSPFWD